MKKYRKFITERFQIIKIIAGGIAVVLMLFALANIAEKPLDTTSLPQHNAALELLKEDFSNLTRIEEGSVEVEKERIIVVFKCDDYTLKAFFNKEGVYTHSEIVDYRHTSDFWLLCVIFLIFAFFCGYGLMCLVQFILFIPLGIILLVRKFRYICKEFIKRLTNKERNK